MTIPYTGNWFGFRVAHADAPALIAINPGSIASLSKTSGTVSFQVNITNGPAINSFFISLVYNRQVLTNPTVDFSNNVLGSNAQVLVECIDGVHITGNAICNPWDVVGVVSLGLFLFSAITTAPTSGPLFQITFNVNAVGFSQLHLFRVILGNGITSTASTSLPYTAADGYFTNMDCPRGSGTLCTPPVLAFTYSPPRPTFDHDVMFNASTSQVTNKNGFFTLYHWDFGDQKAPLDSATPLIDHRFAPCNCSVTLTATDNYGVVFSITIIVPVIFVYIEVAISSMSTDEPVHDLLAGAVIHVTMNLINKSTRSEWINATVTVEGSKIYNTNNTAPTPANGAIIARFIWDSTGKDPGVYEILATLAPVSGANVTKSNTYKLFVRLIYPQVLNGVSLSLIQSLGLGIVVVGAGGFGVSRFLASAAKKRRAAEEANL